MLHLPKKMHRGDLIWQENDETIPDCPRRADKLNHKITDNNFRKILVSRMLQGMRDGEKNYTL